MQEAGDQAPAVGLPVPAPSRVPTASVPPSKPPRSPLRPPPVPVLQDDSDDSIAMAFASLTGLAAITAAQTDKPLPVPTEEEEASTSTPVLTKRQHALHELLSSERAYASDLALIREVHIPLALGQTIPHALPVSPPSSSGSSSRTVSTISDTSTSAVLGPASNGLAAHPPPPNATSTGASAAPDPGQPPMTPDDVKLIFGNITEIAVFSDLFCQALEEALGDLLEGGKGEDHVGALFLSIIPELERPYKQYITRHPTALNHLQSLPQTLSLQNYLSQTQHIASTLSHAWDISSLLIKPVQRLLKYPLLLTAIIDETPDSHSDKETLIEARKQLEEVARNVNEGRRRAEVVRDVLMANKKLPAPGMAVSASVSLTKVKSLRATNAVGTPGTKSSGSNKDDKPEEAILVSHLESELDSINTFAQQFAKNIVEWARMTSNVVLSLRNWSLSFSKVIGLSPTSGSEAFDAYLIVVEKQLMPLCVDLEAVINERVLKELAHLLMTMTQPLKLLASMNEQEPFHIHLMNMTLSPKNRPPPSLLSASTNYLALRGQLATELPTYISLLHRGLRIFIHRLAAIQTEFYAKVRDQWAALWEMLRLEEELNWGGEETVSVWFSRWSEVNEVVASLSVFKDPKVVYAELRARARSLKESQNIAEQRERERGREREDRGRGRERDLDPEADAEYYTLHHLQAFVHHDHSPSIPSSSPSIAAKVSYSPSDIGNGYGGYSNSYAGTSGDRRDSQSSHHYYPQSHSHSHRNSHSHSRRSHSRDYTRDLAREMERDRERERERQERERKKSAAQASNALSLLSALDSPVSPKSKQFPSPVVPPPNRNSAVSGISGNSGGSGSSGVGGGKRRSSDLTSSIGSIISAVGLGNTFGAGGGMIGGIAGSGGSSVTVGAGGEKSKSKKVEKKPSNESFVSKTTVRSPTQHSHHQHHQNQQSHPSPYSPPNSPNRPPSTHAGTSSGSATMARQPTPQPQPHRRRTTGGMEPAPEDLREYEAMMMREEERRREREFAGYRATQYEQHPHQPQHQASTGQRRPSVGNRSVSATNTAAANAASGLPRTKSMPLPYHPLLNTSRPGTSSRGNVGEEQYYGDEQASKRGAGEWSTMAVVDYGTVVEGGDEYLEEDSELFYQSQQQGSGYEPPNTSGGPSGGRSARSRERRDGMTGARSSKNKSQSRPRSSGGRDDESRKRCSEHSAHSSKSDKRSGEKEKDKAGRKRSGSIKSITSFFTSTNHRDSNDVPPSLTHSTTTSTSTSTYTDHTPSPRDSWALKPAKYTCIVIHQCKPPTAGPSNNNDHDNQPLSYFSFPFFTLKEGELYDVLQEAGHPSLHPNLPLIVDEGEDCLLLCRRRGGKWGGGGEGDHVGWALASFLKPCDLGEEEY